MKCFLSLSFVLLLILSCKKKQPEFNEPMNISVYEDLGYGGRQAMLTFETERSLTCGSSVIQGQAAVAGSDVTVTISGINTPPHCQYAPQRVSRSFGLGNLADGVYNLTVKNGNHVSTGTLTITQQKLSIAFSKLNNIVVADSEKMRIPNGAIWGNVMYGDLAKQSMADSFITDIESGGALPLTLPDGEYYYFTIRQGNLTVAYNGVNLYLYRRDFLYHYPGATDSLQRLATDYAYINPQANFYIRTWDGRNFNIPGPPVSTL